MYKDSKPLNPKVSLDFRPGRSDSDPALRVSDFQV